MAGTNWLWRLIAALLRGPTHRGKA